MLMKLRIIPFKGSWLRIISYRHYEKMKKRNRFVNCQKHLHWIHLNFLNGVESHFQKLKNGYFFLKLHFSPKIWFFCRKFGGWIFNFEQKFLISIVKIKFQNLVKAWILVKNLGRKWISRKNLNRPHFLWNDRSITLYFKSVTVYFRFFVRLINSKMTKSYWSNFQMFCFKIYSFPVT